MKCPKCGHEIAEDREIHFRGTATVEGRTTIEKFHTHGILWIPHDSWDETILCPHCNQYFRVKEIL